MSYYTQIVEIEGAQHQCILISFGILRLQYLQFNMKEREREREREREIEKDLVV